MIQKISKSGKFFADLNKKGETSSPEIFKAVIEMNESLEKFRRGFRIKQAGSWASAKNVILD